VDLLLAKVLREQFGHDVPLEVFWRRLGDGDVAILLDGFDEMSGRADKEQRNRLLLELNSLIDGPSLAVLSCRPAYFVQPGEYDKWLAAREARDREARGGAEARTSAVGSRPHNAESLRVLLRSRHIAGEVAEPRELSTVVTIELEPLGEEQILQFIDRFGGRMFFDCAGNHRVGGICLLAADLRSSRPGEEAHPFRDGN
jgi:hypothetical protein